MEYDSGNAARLRRPGQKGLLIPPGPLAVFNLETPLKTAPLRIQPHDGLSVRVRSTSPAEPSLSRLPKAPDMVEERRRLFCALSKFLIHGTYKHNVVVVLFR